MITIHKHSKCKKSRIYLKNYEVKGFRYKTYVPMISNKLYKYKLPASRSAAQLSLWLSLLGVLFLVGGGSMLLMK